jgi:hypothetical protein
MRETVFVCAEVILLCDVSEIKFMREANETKFAKLLDKIKITDESMIIAARRLACRSLDVAARPERADVLYVVVARAIYID